MIIKKLNDDLSIPLYEQVSNSILNAIKRGEYVNGDKIPPEMKLCEIFDVSRITVRKAVEELEERNILIKKRGKGTYVSYPKIVEEINAEGSFTKSSYLANTKPSTNVLSVTKKPVEKFNFKELTNLFQPHSELICAERIRLADGVPMIYEIDYFFGHHDFILRADLKNTPLMETIRKSTGLIASIFEDTFDVKIAGQKESRFLNCIIGTPLLRVEQKVLTEENELIYFNEQYIRQDLYKYVVRLRR